MKENEKKLAWLIFEMSNYEPKLAIETTYETLMKLRPDFITHKQVSQAKNTMYSGDDFGPISRAAKVQPMPSMLMEPHEAKLEIANGLIRTANETSNGAYVASIERYIKQLDVISFIHDVNLYAIAHIKSPRF